MPPIFRELAGQAAAQAGFAGFRPEACLVNRYEPGARLSLHQDRDEKNYRRADRVGVAGSARDLPVGRCEAEQTGRCATGWRMAMSWSGAARRG